MTEIVPADHSPGEIARPADMVLPGTAERIRRGVPKNTQRAYTQAWADFVLWCGTHSRDTLPASAATLADYVAHLCDEGKSPATIKARMGAIAKHHRVAGHPKGVPDTEAANTVLRGYRQDWANEGKRVKEAPPITRARLQLVSAACDKTSLAGKRDRLLLVIGWALAGRRSELAALRLEDVQVVDDELEILIRSSKTDKNAEGETVNVPAGEHVDTDPVGLLADWLEALDQCGVDTKTGSLFRSITRGGKPHQERTVVRKDGAVMRYGAISADAINDIVQRAAQRAGLPNAHLYSAHSLRAGFATQAANDGIPQAIWARHGRWNPTSPVPAKYVRRADKKRDNPLRKMGL